MTSADLLTGDNTREPWSGLGKANIIALEQNLAFMLKQNGPADVLIAIDGRMRDARRCIEDKFADRSHVAEGFITYSGRCSRGVTTKNVLWSNQKVESIYAAFPVNRTRLPTKEREAFSKQGTACGESSTSDPTYSSVTFRALGLFRAAPRRTSG